MGANSSTYIENRRKSALLVLETIKPKIPSAEPSLLLLLTYIHSYVSASSSSHQNIAHLRLNRKLQAYITSATSATASTALFYPNPPQNPAARFLVQFDYDQTQLGRHLRFVQTCVEDLELYEQVLTAIRRKEVLDLKEFVVERPQGQVGRVGSCLLKMREELEYSVAEAPVGGYVSMKGMVDGKEKKAWWDNGNGNGHGVQRRKTLTSSMIRPSTICSTPNNLRPKRPASNKPLSHSNTVKETRSVGKLAHPGFSYAGMRGVSNLADPPSIRGSGPTLPDLPFDDWRGSISTALKVDTSSCSDESLKSKKEEVLPNVRNSWSSSIYSEKSDVGAAGGGSGGGDSYSGGEAGDEESSGSSGEVSPSPSPNSSVEVSPSTAMSSISSEPPTPTPISPYTSTRNNKSINPIPIPLRSAARESLINPVIEKNRTILEDMKDVLTRRNAARGSYNNPIIENKLNIDVRDVLPPRRIKPIIENKRDIADMKDDLPFRNAARESRSTPNLNPTLNQISPQNNKPIPNTDNKILSLETKDLPPTPGPRNPKRLTKLGISEVEEGQDSSGMGTGAGVGKGEGDKKMKGAEKGFKGYYPVEQDWEGELNGVRVYLRREEIVEVRVESGGSYVKVEAWVPLGSVCDALFSEDENSTF